MKTTGRIVALSGLLAVSGQAKVLRWQHDDGSSTWTPARETPLIANSAMIWGAMPTPAPEADKVEEELRKRARNENTCAYVGGNSLDTLTCQGSGQCIYNDFLSLVGCCEEANPTDCTIASTCYHRTESAKLPTTSTGGIYYCDQAAYPNCVTYVYTGNTWNQYTLFGCGETAAVINVDVNPASRTISSGRSLLSTTTTTPTPTPPPPPPEPKKKSNTGAIVGGTVGGIAIIAVAGLAGAFLWRKKQRDVTPTPTSPTTTMAGMGGYTPNPTSPMQETTAGYPPGFVAADNRASMAKMSYNYEPSHISPPASPQPQGYPSGIPSQFPPVNPGQQQYPAVVEQPYSAAVEPQYAAVPQSQYLPYQPPHPTYPQHPGAVEMPTTRGDNELRELA